MIRRRLKFDTGNIAEVGYDRETSTMEVVFRDVPEYLYAYENVSPTLFADLVNAESVGSFFATSIRGKSKSYPFTKSLTKK